MSHVTTIKYVYCISGFYMISSDANYSVLELEVVLGQGIIRLVKCINSIGSVKLNVYFYCISAHLTLESVPELYT